MLNKPKSLIGLNQNGMQQGTEIYSCSVMDNNAAGV
jgi:hypothetical protein